MIRTSFLCSQLTREVPPGYGGVERLVHVLGSALPSYVFSLRSQSSSQDPLSVSYKRFYLPAIPLGRLFLLLPSFQIFHLLTSSTPLIVHLPCPTVLFIASLAKLVSPKRKIVIFWHLGEIWPFFGVKKSNFSNNTHFHAKSSRIHTSAGRSVQSMGRFAADLCA